MNQSRKQENPSQQLVPESGWGMVVRAEHSYGKPMEIVCTPVCFQQLAAQGAPKAEAAPLYSLFTTGTSFILPHPLEPFRCSAFTASGGRAFHSWPVYLCFLQSTACCALAGCLLEANKPSLHWNIWSLFTLFTPLIILCMSDIFPPLSLTRTDSPSSRQHSMIRCVSVSLAILVPPHWIFSTFYYSWNEKVRWFLSNFHMPFLIFIDFCHALPVVVSLCNWKDITIAIPLWKWVHPFHYPCFLSLNSSFSNQLFLMMDSVGLSSLSNRVNPRVNPNFLDYLWCVKQILFCPCKLLLSQFGYCCRHDAAWSRCLGLI